MSRKTDAPHTVYAIQCVPTKRVYIGVTCCLDKRFYQHMSALRRGDKVQYVGGQAVPTLFQQDYNQYGEDAFELYALEQNVDPLDAPYREEYWVLEYRANEPEFGYNIERRYTRKKLKHIRPGMPLKPEKKEEQ